MKGKPENYYILGHCCPEQAIVNMGKGSISPLATYTNIFSCGHGMNFFKFDHSALQLSFDVLHDMAHKKSHALDPLGLQFRAFLYSMLTVFQKPECDASSLSVLVFLTSFDFQPFDSSLEVLPLCNDDAPEGWKCSCESSLTIDKDGGVVSDNSRPLTTNAICTAISMIDRKDIEKINAFALLGGIVDFDRISTGVYTSIIMDNNLQCVTESFANIPMWSTVNKYKARERLLDKKSSFFRRPTASFNHEGGFWLSKPDMQLRNKPQRWSDCPSDPIREIVFVSSSALSKLLAEAHQVFVVFLSPDPAFSLRNAATECFRTETSPEVELSEEYCLAVDNESKHLYWKNKSRCRITNSCNDKGVVSWDSSSPNIENNPTSEKKVKSTQKKQSNKSILTTMCHCTRQELYNHYPTLKPADSCPGCSFKICRHS